MALFYTVEEHKYIYIYGLYGPNSKSRCRYVGKTVNPEARLRQHRELGHRFPHHPTDKSYNYNRELYQWVNILIVKGQKPSMVILEQCDYGIGDIRELYWITKMRAQYSLFNKDSIGSRTHAKALDREWLRLLCYQIQQTNKAYYQCPKCGYKTYRPLAVLERDLFCAKCRTLMEQLSKEHCFTASLGIELPGFWENALERTTVALDSI